MGNSFIVFHALHRSGISTALSSPQLATMPLVGTYAGFNLRLNGKPERDHRSDLLTRIQ